MKVLKNSRFTENKNTAGFGVNKKLIGKTKFSVSARDGYYIHAFKDVLYCTSKSNYTEINFSNGSMILVTKTLKLIEELFPSTQFCRTHQSFLINIQKVKSVKQDLLILEEGTEIPISKSQYKNCLNQIISNTISI